MKSPMVAQERGRPKKEVVERCWRLDVRWLQRLDLLTPPLQYLVKWTDTNIDGDPGSEPLMSVTITMEDPALLLFINQRAAQSTDGTDILAVSVNREREVDWRLIQRLSTVDPAEYSVSITTTTDKLGRTRKWFVCPGQSCRKGRVGTLYLPILQDKFMCRTCHNLSYAQQHRDWLLYARAKLTRISDRLMLERAVFEQKRIVRPVGMRREEFERLKDQLIKTEELLEVLETFEEETQLMLAWYGEIDEDEDDEETEEVIAMRARLRRLEERVERAKLFEEALANVESIEGIHRSSDKFSEVLAEYLDRHDALRAEWQAELDEYRLWYNSKLGEQL